MYNSYHICQMVRPNDPHAACFRELTLLLAHSFQTLGIGFSYALGKLSSDKPNILLGYHLIPFSADLFRTPLIVYQLEQLNSPEFPFNAHMEKILRGAAQVWDFSRKNIAFLNGLGIAARYLPPGYHQKMALIPGAREKTLDVLFYGSIGPRRRKIIEELAQVCRIQALFSVYGDERDNYIRQARIILNLHHWSGQLFEAVRVSYLLNNSCFVLSETSGEYPYPGVQLPVAPYEAITESCISWLSRPAEMERIRGENAEAFKLNYPMTELLKGVL